MDILVDLLERTGARGAAFGYARTQGRWAIEFPPCPGIGVHVITEGKAVVVTAAGGEYPLVAGDLALVRESVSHRLASARDVATESLASFSARQLSSRELVDEESSAGTTFMCGAYSFTGDLLTSLIEQLPLVLVVHSAQDSPLRRAVDLLALELGVEVVGQQTVLDRILDVIVIGVLRAHLASAGPAAPGWHRATEDPGVARALSAVHADPARKWTVESLASLSALSRSTFAHRFAEVVGVPPLEYVTGWRMALARERLRDTAEPLAAIARASGYRSEYAFASAFKRLHGLAPGKWRSNERIARSQG